MIKCINYFFITDTFLCQTSPIFNFATKFSSWAFYKETFHISTLYLFMTKLKIQNHSGKELYSRKVFLRNWKKITLLWSDLEILLQSQVTYLQSMSLWREIIYFWVIFLSIFFIWRYVRWIGLYELVETFSFFPLSEEKPQIAILLGLISNMWHNKTWTL